MTSSSDNGQGGRKAPKTKGISKAPKATSSLPPEFREGEEQGFSLDRPPVAPAANGVVKAPQAASASLPVEDSVQAAEVATGTILSGPAARMIGGSKVELPPTPAPVEDEWIISSPPGTDKTVWEKMPKGEVGPPGPEGPEGPQGPPGEGIQIIGTVSTVGDLDPNYNGNIGDVFVAEDTGHGHSWNGAAWDDIGQMVGPEGPEGPQGPQGDPGEAGEAGPPGDTGADGTTWYSGITSPPSEGLGVNGDFYLDTVLNQYYGAKIGNSWVGVGPYSLEGPEGPQGDQGPQGIQGEIGPDGPQGIQGVQGVTGDQGIQGEQGLQGLKGNTGETGDAGPQGPIGPDGPQGPIGLTGPQGDTGDPGAPGAPGQNGRTIHNGSGTPADGLGQDGDLYIDPDTNELWGPKAAGTWTGTGPIQMEGSSWFNGSGAPAAGLGKDDDYYLDVDTDEWYVKIAGVWTLQGDFTGAQGPQGIQGEQGVQGDPGPQGEPGEDGTNGSGVTIRGTDTWSNIQALPSPAAGDMWLLSIDDATAPDRPGGTGGLEGDGLTWDGAQWTNVGPIKGPQGDTGPEGPQGEQGIQGIQGEVGPDGPQGLQGIQGIQGIQGETGDTGPEGPSAVSTDAENRAQLGGDSLIWVPPAIRWKGDWAPGTYNQYDMVVDDPYTGVANKQTTDRPAPQNNGSDYDFYSGASPTSTITAKQLTVGQRYTWGETSKLNGLRLYTVTGNIYRVYSVKDPLGTPIHNEVVPQFTASNTGWQNFGVDPVIAEVGTVFDLYVSMEEPDPTPTVWTANYNYTSPANEGVPTSGQALHANKGLSTIRFHKTDDDGTDRAAALLALTSGDVIDAVGMRWAIQSAPTDQGTYVEVAVAPAQQGAPAGVSSFQFETVASTPITVINDVDFWIGNAECIGRYQIDGGAWVDTEAQYSVDLNIQPITISPDWDLLPVGGSGGSSGGGEAGPPGADGSVWHAIAVSPPHVSLGVDGDFAIDTVLHQYFGPKTGGSWGGVGPYSLEGPQGPQGVQGDMGDTGPQGLQGIQGEQGIQGVQGLQGDTGPEGPQGNQGDPGNLGADGKTWYNGSGAPSDVTGVNGDFYLDTAADAYYGPKAANSWTSTGPTSLIGPTGPQGDQGVQGEQGIQGEQGLTGDTGPQGDQGPAGTNGTDGKTWHNGAGAPTTEGVNGDFYLDTAADAYYGPKAADSWSGTGPTSLIGPTGPQGNQGDQGDQGDQGPSGTNGTNGTDGRTWYNGTGAPSEGLGVNDDFYLDTAADTYYGPKTNDSWIGTGPTSIVGPQGTAGDTGSQGDQGIQGEQGIQGIQGDQGLTGNTGDTGPAGPILPYFYRSFDAASIAVEIDGTGIAVHENAKLGEVAIDYLAFHSTADQEAMIKMQVPEEWAGTSLKAKLTWGAGGTSLNGQIARMNLAAAIVAPTNALGNVTFPAGITDSLVCNSAAAYPTQRSQSFIVPFSGTVNPENIMFLRIKRLSISDGADNLAEGMLLLTLDLEFDSVSVAPTGWT